ncbi:MAG: ribosome maturation factor RimM [Longimicrobiales bacterium]|nr:ribosome maturation factor RimM [Longimicrobiales bacterium]
MGRKDPTHLVVGHLARPHGTRGEFLCGLLTDHPESAFAPGMVLSLGGANDDVPDPDLPPLRIESVRMSPKGALVVFGGVTDRTQAEQLQGRYLFLPIDQLEPLADGEVFYHQLLDMTVETVEGDEVGTVSEVYEMGPADLLEVRGERGVLMIPYRPEIVVEVDIDEGRLVIDPPNGLLDL